jgi:hypothetical protein
MVPKFSRLYCPASKELTLLGSDWNYKIHYALTHGSRLLRWLIHREPEACCCPYMRPPNSPPWRAPRRGPRRGKTKCLCLARSPAACLRR